jgi:hypothetical protein
MVIDSCILLELSLSCPIYTYIMCKIIPIRYIKKYIYTDKNCICFNVNNNQNNIQIYPYILDENDIETVISDIMNE